ncbi:MAG: c-type cytochrome, partial [Salinibacterium sp.]|nr:c-type cytochrome [Salinibacterium sp.]
STQAAPVSTLTDGIVAAQPAINDAGWLQRIFFRANTVWEPAADSDFLFMAILWFSIFWFVLLIGLSIYWVIKYRRRPGVPAPVSASHNTKLEIAWTVIPSLFLVYLFFAGFQPYLHKLIAPPDSLRYSVTGQKWLWNIAYPNGKKPTETVRTGTYDIPVVYVPAGRPTMFRLSSSDVIHSWWVPDFRTKIDCIPNRYTSVWIEPEPLNSKDYVHEDGYRYREHWVFCAEYCGDDHSEMAALLRVVPYDVWLTKIEGTLEGEAWEIGRQIAQLNGCFGCHSVDGSPNTGPTWQNNYGYPREFSNAPALTQSDLDSDPVAMDNYIRESIYVPSAKIRAGYTNGMTPYAGVLNDAEVDSIIAYFKHLSDRGPSIEAAADEAAEYNAEPEAGSEDPEPAATPGSEATPSESENP